MLNHSPENVAAGSHRDANIVCLLSYTSRSRLLSFMSSCILLFHSYVGLPRFVFPSAVTCDIFFIRTRQVTRATHVRNRVCPRVELLLKIIIILLIIFLGFIKSKPC